MATLEERGHLTALLTSLLGMPETAASRYVELLQGSQPLQPTSDEELHDLTLLESLGFAIAENAPSGPKRYYPLDAALVAASLEHQFAWKSLPEGNKITKANVQRLCALISKAAAPRSPEQIATPFSYIAGTAAISNFLATIIPQATNLLCISAAVWATNLPLIWAALKKRLEEGLDYRRVATLASFIAFGYEINRRDLLELHINLRVVTEQAPSPILYVITTSDATRVLLFNDVQLQQTGRKEATFVTHPRLVESLAEVAERIWISATPAIDLLAPMHQIRHRFLDAIVSRLGFAHAETAEAIFDYGVFADTSLSATDHLSALEREGFIQKTVLDNLGISHYQASILSDLQELGSNRATR